MEVENYRQLKICVGLMTSAWHNLKVKRSTNSTNNWIDAYHHDDLKYRTFTYRYFRKYTNFVSFFFPIWDEECVPGEINAHLRSKIRDANKYD